MGQKGILLALVEAVNLVNKEDGWLGALLPERFCLLDDLTDFLDPGKHGGKKDELRGNGLGKNGGQGCFTGTGRSPEHQGGDGAAVDQLAKKLSLANQMFLADEILEASWAHPLG